MAPTPCLAASLWVVNIGVAWPTQRNSQAAPAPNAIIEKQRFGHRSASKWGGKVHLGANT